METDLFSQSAACLFTLQMVSLMNRLLILMKFDLSVFSFIASAFHVLFGNLCDHDDIFKHLLLDAFFFTFRSMIHLKYMYFF